MGHLNWKLEFRRRGKTDVGGKEGGGCISLARVCLLCFTKADGYSVERKREGWILMEREGC